MCIKVKLESRTKEQLKLSAASGTELQSLWKAYAIFFPYKFTCLKYFLEHFVLRSNKNVSSLIICGIIGTDLVNAACYYQ